MNPGAVARFHAAQTRLLQSSYRRAWEHGVASYAPDDDPTAAEQEQAHDRALLVAGTAGLLLAARARRYRPPAAPDRASEARAVTGARGSLDRMAGELMALTATADHVDQATAAARAGEIDARDIASYAEGLAVQDWAESNAWRLNAGDSVAWAGEQAGYSEAANADGQLLEWLPEADERVCDDCEQLGNLPPMPLEDWPTHPGMGDTICNAGCRCVLQVSDEQHIGPEGELPTALTSDQEDYVSELAERREPYAEGPITAPTGAIVGDQALGRAAEAMYAPDVSQALADRDLLYAQAERVKPEFDEILHRAGADIGADRGVSPGFRQALEGDKPAVITAPLKAKDARATEKVNGKYQGDWTRLKDIVRGTIAVPKEAELAGVLDAVQRQVTAAGWRVVGVENRYSLEAGSRVNTGASGFGYRDVSMHLVSPDGHVAELQVNTIPMMQAKEFGGGHQFYEDIRAILERDSSTWTAAERRQVQEATRKSIDLYGAAERTASGGL